VNAAAILAACARAGVRLTAEGQCLRIKPLSRVGGVLRALIVEHKAELLVALRGPQRGCRACDNRRYVRVRGGPEFFCIRCHPVREDLVVEEHHAPEPSLWEAWRNRPRTPQPATRNPEPGVGPDPFTEHICELFDGEIVDDRLEVWP
jgi:hypothetical protein